MSEAIEAAVIAEVERVCRGESGDYVFAFTQTHGSVTFSLHQNVWKGGSRPIEGEVVMLSELHFKKDKGWRAENARLPTPEEISRYLGGEVKEKREIASKRSA